MYEYTTIAKIHTDFGEKFGTPRQSGLIQNVAKIIMEPEYRTVDIVRGLDTFSHIWLLWVFSKNNHKSTAATVRPPRLGGNERMGVFATRSPYRPNPIGLSSVRLQEIRIDEKLGPVLQVVGADMVDGTPILDIKPYLPYADSHPEALSGYTQDLSQTKLEVSCDKELMDIIPERLRESLVSALSLDPRPAYQKDPDRVYTMLYAGYDVKFTIADGVLRVIDIYPYL